ncbi:MAG: type II toxin-antitoxin system VapC family toxin [Nitrospira sp.]|nr:MAG: type II toxin-antitoxin system VapC family toxin [Nitrospira sp.]
MSEHVLRHVEELVQKTDVRALNALHIASAIMFKAASGLAIPFITSDAKQRDAAQATGLTVIWVD